MKLKKITSIALTAAMLLGTQAAFAAEESSSDEVYVLMNIPYAQFYEAEGVASYNESIVDAETHATNKVGNYGKAGGTYHSKATAEQDENGNWTAVGGANGAVVEGVTWPVKASSIEAVKALGGKEVTDDSTVTIATNGRGQTSSQKLTGSQTLTENPEYSYYVLDEAPAYYFELTENNGKASFSSLKGTAKAVDGADADVTYGTNWGDVQFDVTGFSDEVNASQTNAVVLTAEDGTKGGLVALYNIWSQTSWAWKISEVAGLEGKKITNIRYYGNDKNGNYFVNDYAVDIDILDKFDGEAAAVFTAEKEIMLAGLPDDIENPVAMVYNLTVEGSGRNAKRTYVYLTPYEVEEDDGDIIPQTSKISDNKVSLNDSPVVGSDYTVSVSSDNYAPFTITDVVYSEVKEYKLSGAAEYKLESGDEVKVTSDAELDDLVAVFVDGKELSADSYSAEAGSTVISFKNDYLDTLEVGEHAVEILSADGEAKGSIVVLEADKKTENDNEEENSNETENNTVEEKTNEAADNEEKTSPVTGEGYMIAVVASIMLVSVLGMALTRRKNNA